MARARSRSCSRSARTTCAPCTSSTIATRWAAASRAAVPSRAGRSGRTHSISSRPAGHDLNYFTAFALLGVVTLVVARRSRALAFCALTVAAPVLFFSVVPANGDSALFFDRYMIPATPAFLTLVVAGCLGAARWAGAWRLLALAILVAGLVAIELRFDANRRDGQRDIRLDAVTRGRAPRAGGHRPVRLDGDERRRVLILRLRPSGQSARPVPRPARAVARIRRRRLLRARRRRSCAATRRSAGSGSSTRLPRPSRLRHVGPSRGCPVQRRRRLRAATSSSVHARRLPPRALVALGRSLRLRWRSAVPLNQRVDELLQADRQLLARPPVCTPYGDLGDPDISPHWPPVTTNHQ